MLNALMVVAMAMPVSFEVPGLTCPTCVKPVKKTLALMDGVNRVDIDWRARKVKLDIDPSKTNEKHIRAALDKIGFSAADTAKPLMESETQDYLTVSAALKVEQLAVWGKATIVAVCTPGCAPALFKERFKSLFETSLKSGHSDYRCDAPNIRRLRIYLKMQTFLMCSSLILNRSSGMRGQRGKANKCMKPLNRV